MTTWLIEYYDIETDRSRVMYTYGGDYEEGLTFATMFGAAVMGIRPVDKPFREIAPTHEDASATDVVTRWTHDQTKHFSDGLQRLLDEEQ